MKTEIILKVDTLKNLVKWLNRDFVRRRYRPSPSNARALFIFANKPDTPLDADAMYDYSKFSFISEAEQYFNSFENMKFIIESELIEETIHVFNEGMKTEFKVATQIWKITVTPSTNNTEDAFNMYLAEPYNPA